MENLKINFSLNCPELLDVLNQHFGTRGIKIDTIEYAEDSDAIKCEGQLLPPMAAYTGSAIQRIYVGDPPCSPSVPMGAMGMGVGYPVALSAQ